MSSFLGTVCDAYDRRLPARYECDLWDRALRMRLEEGLHPGVRVLDIGAGARPVLPADKRPDGSLYVGLDIDAAELAKAPPGSYDAMVTGSGEVLVPALIGKFDIVVSFLALEHVRSTELVLANARKYLKPGGRLLLQLAGAFSPSALANRIVPMRVVRRLLRWSQNRHPDTVFAAHYDHCWYTGLDRLMRTGWKQYEVRPLFVGAGYVLFSRTLTACYLAYEEWTYRRGYRNLATYYLITAISDDGDEPT